MREFERPGRPRRSVKPVVIGMLATFALGAAVAGYGVYRFVDHAPGSGAARTAAAGLPAEAPRAGSIPGPGPSPSVSASAEARDAVQAARIVAQQQGGLDQRLAAAEQRIARLDLQAQAASGNAARAEGLLIAFSARRALERGNDLGYLGDQLRLRFGDAMPNAVQTIIAFGRRPVTLDQLIARLDTLAPDLAQTTRRVSWDQLRQEIASLFTVRRESTPSPQPARRLERARLFLQSGRVEAAIAEVRYLPGADEASGWIADARRYADAQNALELIETAAVLEPRKLRGGDGRAIEQPGPGAAVAPLSGAQ